MDDLISRQAVDKIIDDLLENDNLQASPSVWHGLHVIKQLPSAQPEPMSESYMKAVWTWLLDYQIKTAELKGRYTPYEVLSWVANDWRKEHERFNKQTGGD